MDQEGKYLYCIIESDEGRNFGPIGIGQRGDVVSTIGLNNISAVISNTLMTQYVINRANMTAHESVIEKVMKDYTVLPVRFCTIAASAEEIRTLLRRRSTEFKGLLRDMDNKVEMGLKALWKNINQIFDEIVAENSEIKRLKKNAEDKSRKSNSIHKINLGRAVKLALEAKKTFETRKILKALKPLVFDIKTNDSYGDSMFINAAFLIDRTREKELDLLIGDMTEEDKERVTFRYVGPAPPFNFVNIEVKW